MSEQAPPPSPPRPHTHTHQCRRAGLPRPAEPEPSGSARCGDSTWSTPPTSSQSPQCTPERRHDHKQTGCIQIQEVNASSTDSIIPESLNIVAGFISLILKYLRRDSQVLNWLRDLVCSLILDLYSKRVGRYFPVILGPYPSVSLFIVVLCCFVLPSWPNK